MKQILALYKALTHKLVFKPIAWDCCTCHVVRVSWLVYEENAFFHVLLDYRDVNVGGLQKSFIAFICTELALVVKLMHKLGVPWTAVAKKVNTIALSNKKTVLA